ncbi:c-type cytochrome [Deinococcus maricopensis]|uniref:Cytochrome c class I n=1 Tax=Deinococcus maricopensis (strain DSM 21211 / LMG 22137 / NRRL B-23946 / LB-34) TaxID=709986 RepID=E8U815_DEIML|nr:cytochrome c [Deinococcus maricopensis]ADV67204.1 cytochrome c class I [Deinococcus maricopensis DSM 21211]
MNGTKSTFWVSVTLLLALTVGGGVFGYRVATAEPPGAESSAEGDKAPNTANTGEGSQNQANGEMGQPEGNEQGAESGTGAQGGTALEGGTNPSQDASPEGQQAGNTGTDATGTPGSAAGSSGSDDGNNPDDQGTSSNGQSGTGASDSTTGQTENGANGATVQEAQESSTATAQPDASAPAGSGAPSASNTSEAEQVARTGNPEQGKAIFATCAGCHGSNGEGVVGPAINGNDGPKTWTLAQFTATLREGKTPERQLSTAMPRFSKEQIPDEAIPDLQAYIRTLD